MFPELVCDPGNICYPNLEGGIEGPEALGVESPVRSAGLPDPDHLASGFAGKNPPALPASALAYPGEPISYVFLHANIISRL